MSRCDETLRAERHLHHRVHVLDHPDLVLVPERARARALRAFALLRLRRRARLQPKFGARSCARGQERLEVCEETDVGPLHQLRSAAMQPRGASNCGDEECAAQHARNMRCAAHAKIGSHAQTARRVLPCCCYYYY
jgi:hypothetical protein